MNSSKTARIAVIGAGMAGLTAVQRLVAGGAHVTLIEKAHGPGGRASTLERDSFYLNQGPHALYKGGAAYEILTNLNIIPAGAAPAPKRSLAILNGEILDLPVDASSIISTKLLSIAEKVEWGMLMGNLAKVDLSKLQNVSVAAWLDSAVKSERVKAVFKTMVRLGTYSNSPEKISAAAAIQQLIIALRDGVLYLDHGWQSLVESMVQSIEKTLTLRADSSFSQIYGAEVTAIAAVTSATVSSAAVSSAAVSSAAVSSAALGNIDGREEGVEITFNGSKQYFDAAILALPPKQVSKLLTNDTAQNGTGPNGAKTNGAKAHGAKAHGAVPNAALQAKLDAVLPSHAACLDVCLKKLPISDHTFALGIDQPLYYSVHSTTAKVAEGNQALVHLAVYLPEGEKGTEEHEKILLQLLDQLQPGWTEELVYKRFLPNMVASFGTALASENGSTGFADVALPVVSVESIAHVESAISAISATPEEESKSPSERFFVCGDWVGSGHLLLDAAMSSAASAAHAALATVKTKSLCC